MSDCAVFVEYGLYIVYAVVFLLGLLLLRFARRGPKLSFGECVLASWNLTACVFHLTFDTYFFFAPHVTVKKPKEMLPSSGDYQACYVASLRHLWRTFGNADARIYLTEYHQMVLTLAYGALFGGGLLCFLTFFGHMRGAKWSHAMQIAAAVWHLGVGYSFTMPEVLVGFKHVKDMTQYVLLNIPFNLMPLWALMSSFSKISSSGTSGAGGSQEKKKMQ